MLRRLCVVFGTCCLLGSLHTASAQPDPPAAVAALVQKETAARAKAADEMASAARFCAASSAYDDARQAYATALAFRDHAPFKAEVAKLKGKKSAPAKGAVAQVAERRKKSLTKCAEILAPVAAAYAQAERSDDLARLVALLRAQRVPVEGSLAKLEVVYFEPYLDFRRKKDVEKFEAGWEVLDGAWVDPKKIAALDAEHGSWKNPWVVTDDVHVVRTTLPLRTAKQVLAHVGAFRRFFLDYFAGEWDLRTPAVKLPIILTGTRAELEAQTRAFAAGAPPLPAQAAAFYLAGNGAGNPCFVSFELRGTDGSTTKVAYPELLFALEHEVGHQIAFEYSKHAADASRVTDSHFWAVEGVAQFLPAYDLADGVWTLRYPRRIPIGGGYFEGAFAWCHDHTASIPPVGQFVALTHQQFMTVENYHIAAGLALFLLEGKDRAYRQAYVKLLETVHQARENSGTFAACFEGIDLVVLDAEFRAFVKTIALETK